MWRNVCYSGHINKYALFAELCCKLAKKGGLVALVLPSSFVAGPLYDLLRAHLRNSGQLLVLGSVPSRHDVFADVAQDVSVLVLQKGTAHDCNKTVSFGRFPALGKFKPRSEQRLPDSERSPWPVPARAKGLSIGGYTLESYGAKVRSGYFVWNREGERMYTRCYSESYVPLVWAKNVRAGTFCKPRNKAGDGTDYVKFFEETSAVIRSEAIVLQRTTNSAQKRRLIAARISPLT
jgi:adenine-specific DNA-methyltransferase